MSKANNTRDLEPVTGEFIPSEKQRQYVELYLEHGSRKTNDWILKEIGITKRLYYTWQKDPNYVYWMTTVVAQRLNGAWPEVAEAMLKQIKLGSSAHLKLYADIMDKYTPKIEVAVMRDDLENLSDEELEELAKKAAEKHGRM